MIIGADFLKQKQIFVGYSETGKCVLEYKHLELINSITMDESPQLVLTKTLKIPQCSLVVLNTRCMATADHVGQLYKVRTNHLIQNNHPNLIMLSTVHRIDKLVSDGIPLEVINMGISDICCPKTLLWHI